MKTSKSSGGSMVPLTNLQYTPTRANSKIRIPCTNCVMSDPSLQLVPRHRKIEPRTSAKSVLSRYLRGKPLIEPSVPAAASRAAPPLRNRIEPMEEEGAVGQRSRRSPSPRRSPPAVEGVLVGDEGGDIESRPTHVTGGMGDERERCALRRRLRRARGRRKPRSRSTPRCNGSLASIQLSRQQKWGWSGWGWMPIEGERLQLRPVAAAPCGS